MTVYFKEELKRAFLSKITIGTAILSVILVFIGMLEYLMWLPYGNISLLYIFLSGYNSGTACFLSLLFPIISCLPFSISYLEDIKSGFNKYIYLRTNVKQYKTIRFIVNGIVGGTVLFIGPFVAFLFLLAAKVFTGIPMVLEDMETYSYFQSIGIHSPVVMIIIILISLFCCGFIIASFALGLSTLIQNVYITILAPFIYFIISATILLDIAPYLNLLSLYDVDYYGASITQRVLFGFILFLIGTVLFFVGGKINEHNTI